jgi:hypothetical protein
VRCRILVAAAVLVAAGAYFVFDVRQRARVDRAPSSHRTDFTVYQYAARALADGEDPYEARNPRGYRYVYPPLLCVLLLPVAHWDPADGALVFFVASAAAFLAVLAGLLRRAPGGRGPPLPWQALAAGVLVCLGFAHQGFQRGQVTHVLLFLQVVALWDLIGGRPGRAGLWLGLGAALRLTPLLPAAAVGLGLLVAGLRARSARPTLHYGGGLASGLLVGFVLLPVLALGWGRARAVTERWLEVTEDVYAGDADLDTGYRINEWRFKNQAPRRVFGTWSAWAQGASFEKERPALDEAALAPSRRAADGVTWALLALALLLGACGLRDPSAPPYAVRYALLLLLPVLMTRYAWPTHYLAALPAVALAWATGRRGPRAGVLALFAGTALFYAAHARPLQVVGEAGVLLIACVAFLALLLSGGPRGAPA